MGPRSRPWPWRARAARDIIERRGGSSRRSPAGARGPSRAGWCRGTGCDWRRRTVRARLDPDALAFSVLRGLTMIGGLAALSIVPLRPEHEIHLLPLLGAFIAYKAALFTLLFFSPEHARPIFLATLGTDLGIVFILVWFTGGGESHFYLLFLILVALKGCQFAPGKCPLA